MTTDKKKLRKLYLCKCGKCFAKRDKLVRHLQQTKRWVKRHYAPDYTEIPFIIWEVKQ